MAQNFKKRKKTLFFAEKLYYQLGPALISISDFVKNGFFLVETEQKKCISFWLENIRTTYKKKADS